MFCVLETLAEGRSKVKDAQSHDVPVVLKGFLAGVKTEGVVSMVRQHTISTWGQEPDAKIQKARAAAEGGESLKSSGMFQWNLPSKKEWLRVKNMYLFRPCCLLCAVQFRVISSNVFLILFSFFLISELKNHFNVYSISLSLLK